MKENRTALTRPRKDWIESRASSIIHLRESLGPRRMQLSPGGSGHRTGVGSHHATRADLNPLLGGSGGPILPAGGVGPDVEPPRAGLHARGLRRRHESPLGGPRPSARRHRIARGRDLLGRFRAPGARATTVIAALRTRRFPCAETPLALDGTGCLPASPLVADPV